MRSISHELVTYFNGAYEIICELNQKVQYENDEFSN